MQDQPEASSPTPYNAEDLPSRRAARLARRKHRLDQAAEQAARAPAPTSFVGEKGAKYTERSRQNTLDMLEKDLQEDSSQKAPPPPPAPESVTEEVSDVVLIPGATTRGGVTSYQPVGDPYRYEYDANTGTFSAFNLNGEPVVTGVKKGDQAYGEFLTHAQGGRTRYYGGAPKDKTTVDELAPDTVDADESATLEAEAGDTSPPVDEPTGADASSPAKYSRGVATGPQKSEVSDERPKISVKSGVPEEERLGEIGALVGADSRVDPTPFVEATLGTPDLGAVTKYINDDTGRVNFREVNDAIAKDEFSLEDWNSLETVLKNAGYIAYDAPPTQILFGGPQPIISEDGVLVTNNLRNALMAGTLDINEWPRIKAQLEEEGAIKTQIGADPTQDPAFRSRIRTAQAASRAMSLRG